MYTLKHKIYLFIYLYFFTFSLWDPFSKKFVSGLPKWRMHNLNNNNKKPLQIKLI